MNQAFKNFLDTRKNPDDCEHGKEWWCNKCVNTGTYVDLRNERYGHGFILTNFKQD